MTPKGPGAPRFGGLCDIPQIRAEAGRGSGATTTLILNGTTVYWEFDVGSLCSWRADEVELIEFGTDPCRDVTQTIVEILNSSGPPMGKQIVCSGRAQAGAEEPRRFRHGRHARVGRILCHHLGKALERQPDDPYFVGAGERHQDPVAPEVMGDQARTVQVGQGAG
jgi:hypothetical protein